jgi:hypothetical protein
MSVVNGGEENLQLAGNQVREVLIDKIAALGQAGLSLSSLHELEEVFSFDPEGDPLAYSLAVGGITLLLQAREVASSTAEPATKAYAAAVVPLHHAQPLPHETLEKATATPAIVGSIYRGTVRPDPEKSQEKTLRPAVAGYLGQLLKLESLPADLTPDQAQQIIAGLFEKYTASLARNAQTAVGERHRAELRLYLEGYSDQEISKQLRVKKAGLGAFRSVLKLRLHGQFSASELQAIAFSTGEIPSEEATAEPQAAIPVAPVEHGAATEVTQSKPENDLAWHQRIEDLVSLVWHPEDVSGLMKLLHNEGGNDVDQARHHLQALLASFVPLRPAGGTRDATILLPVEWDTINHISGYNLQQTERPGQPRYMSARLGKAYSKHHTSFEESFENALTTLLQKAAQDYAAGWYPGSRQSTSNVEKVERKVDDGFDISELHIDEVERSIASGVKRLLGNSRKVNEQDTELLIRHFSGKPSGLTGERLLRLTAVLSAKINQSHQSAMRVRSNGGNVQTITSVQNEILQDLLGSISPYRDPKTIDEVAAKRRSTTGDRVDRTQITAEVGKALRTLARH